jgi:hypothetical protein
MVPAVRRVVRGSNRRRQGRAMNPTDLLSQADALIVEVSGNPAWRDAFLYGLVTAALILGLAVGAAWMLWRVR